MNKQEIQRFLGAVAGQGGIKGLFITTSSFTKEAINFANLMMEYNLGVSVENTYEIKRIDMDYFDEEIS